MKNNERTISVDGVEVLCRQVYGLEEPSSHIEFYVKDGYDEEFFPYTYDGETSVGSYKNINCLSEDDLVRIYQNL